MSFKNTLFLQFYRTQKSHGFNCFFKRKNNYYNLEDVNTNLRTVLSTGFISAYNKCKELGDFYWLEYHIEDSIEKTIKRNKGVSLPIKRGTIYISAFYNVHLYQSYLWALEYPEVKFIVGGPALDLGKLEKSLPKNLILTEKSINELLCATESWGLDFPENIAKEVLWGIPITRNCYWNKCLFCNYPKKADVKYGVDLGFLEFIKDDKRHYITLYTPSAAPQFLENIFSHLNYNKNFNYIFLLRASDDINNALKRILSPYDNAKFDFSRFVIASGLEFPTNRMLSWLQKGVTAESIIRTIQILHEYNFRINPQIMLGFNNLVPEDVENIEWFLKKISGITDGKLVITLNNLICKINTPIYNMFEKGEELKLGPFNFGFIPKITKEQQKLNDLARDAIYSANFKLINDFYSDIHMKSYGLC